jgi:hypothetical protein
MGSSELLIGKNPVLLERFPLPDEGDFVASPSTQMSVQAVITGIQLSAQEPFHLWLGEIPFQDFIPLLIPVELLCSLTPSEGS